jgi:hypothetical protein
MDKTALAATLEDLRFLRYRWEVVSEMPRGRERDERLRAIKCRMHRLENDLRAA